MAQNQIFFSKMAVRSHCRVCKGMGSLLVVVCVGKYPGGESDSRFYRVLLKLLVMQVATGSQGCSVLLAKLY